jgi:hypothetical protein
VLHPETHELGDILMGFPFESGDKIVQIKTSAAPGFQHVGERRAENFLTVTILQAIEK